MSTRPVPSWSRIPSPDALAESLLERIYDVQDEDLESEVQIILSEAEERHRQLLSAHVR